ncbi:dynamin family protein, partial [bacterium]|nr:dynamin family protein [bacterium]
MQNIKLDQFQEKWIPVGNEINRIREMRILPIKIGETEWTDDLLQNTIRNLKDDKFTISICGAVKAGKSTFLNSLLFGREVLPAFDTPLTAKLTFIEYTDKPSYFTASFFSDEEWREYLDSLSPEAESDLTERMEISAERGVHPQQTVGCGPRT